jgi:SNF2 family DNA or RNA helicase
MMQLARTPLWKHQIEDVAHLREQDKVLIANEMGTGKTLTAVERDLQLRDLEYRGPTLVVAPLSTHTTWLETFERESDLKVTTINRNDREGFLEVYAEVYIMHYEALRLMPWLRQFKFGHVIFDECHRLKTRTTKQTKAAKKLKPPYITMMSGSPVTDRPQDIWQILAILKPREYTSFWRFFEDYIDYKVKTIKKTDPLTGKTKIINYKEAVGPAEAWTTTGLPAIRHFFTRRLKVDVMPNLPPKMYSKVYVDLSAEQRRIYNEMRDDMLTWIMNSFGEEEALPAPAVIAMLQRLQMIALGTPEFGIPVTKKNGDVVTPIKLVEPSTKCDAVMEILEDNESEQFVIFSQFKGPLRILRGRFGDKGITYGSYTGDDNERFRERDKRLFISGDNRVLLGTISAGGVGVDGLQHASCNVIFMDRNWSPAINEQAEDRLHRGGQTRNVNITDIMARNTIDFDRMKQIDMKAGWVKKMLGDT